MYSLTWLADVLRNAGLAVVEEPGWQTRGRPGPFGPVRGVLEHHTASSAHGGNAPDLATVRDGRSDLPGPLAHLLLARDGTFHVIAAGRCNHAGAGSWHGILAGNTEMIGIEAENDGVSEPWPANQLDALARGTAALLAHIHADSVMAAGHKEYALPRGRKIDPDIDMVAFREHVEALMGGAAPTVITIPQTDPKRAMLRKGDQGNSVRVLQSLLRIGVDGGFGPETETAVKAFQSKHGLTPDGLVGPETWKALGQ
jgi:N-acetyl-anhydromuramyl-L-alanine amidase AmpD